MAFTFKTDEEKKVILEFPNDVSFTVHRNGEMMNRLNEAGKRMIEYGNSKEAEEDSDANAAFFLYDIIDDLLGDGASDRIFAGRDPDSGDATDVVRYISKEIQRPQNRAQRRAETKKSGKNRGGKHYNGAYHK